MTLRVAVAHEWLVRYGGSERCVEQMLEAFPGAQLLTTLLDAEAVPPVFRRAEASALQRVPGAVSHHEWFLPVMPLAWRMRGAVKGVDVVISSSHACAKAVRVERGTPHICYCHTPMRYAWNFEAERERFPSAVGPLARAGMVWFRRWDRKTAQRVSHFIANSTAVARRIERFFGRPAQVIHPPVRTDFFTTGGDRDDYFLYAGRLVSYKRADLVVEAFAGLPDRLLVAGEGPLRRALEARASPNVSFLGRADDERLRELYRSARALVYPADEDFGIVMAEAQACGTPVVGLRAGGAMDIVEPGRTGWLIERQTVEEVRGAIRRVATHDFDAGAISSSAQRFSPSRFRQEIREAVAQLLKERDEARPTAGATVSVPDSTPQRS